MSRQLDWLQQKKWDRFIEELAQKPGAFKAPPAKAVARVAEYIEPGSRVLDLGTELGKNALPFLKKGCHLSLLDVSGRAIEFACDYFEKQNYSHLIEQSVRCTLEDSPELDLFDAVVGSYIFSFITPSHFEEIMRTKVFQRVCPGGLFGGHFFAPGHSWESNEDLTIVGEKKLSALLKDNGFEVLEMLDSNEKSRSVFQGEINNRNISVVARAI